MPGEPEQGAVIYKEKIEKEDHERLAGALTEATNERITAENTIPPANQQIKSAENEDASQTPPPARNKESFGERIGDWWKRQRGKIAHEPSESFRAKLKTRLEEKNPDSEIVEKQP